jgi:RNA polymerase sigma-70 factor (ECF subfamily)
MATEEVQDSGAFKTWADPVETRWTLVLRACAGSTSALEDLCAGYWQVLFHFFRRKGLTKEDAEDLVQNTLSSLTRGAKLQAVDRSKGRFRSFLFGCATHELARFFRRNYAAKRRGGVQSKEDVNGVAAVGTEAFPCRDFDRAWSVAVAERALKHMAECRARNGRDEQWRALLPFLQQPPEEGQYAALGARLGVTEGNARVMVSRLRKEFRAAVLREVTETVADPREAPEEMKYLLSLWVESARGTG